MSLYESRKKRAFKKLLMWRWVRRFWIYRLHREIDGIPGAVRRLGRRYDSPPAPFVIL